MFTVRPATAADAGLILDFIIELAVYEKARESVVTNADELRRTLFGPQAKARALICEDAGQAIGYAVYFYNYSTWLGKNGLYLEDVYVSPPQRGRGAGKALLKHLAAIAVAENCGRFEWSVLDWNQSAIDFYEALGAKAQSEWTTYRLTGEALERFARE
jgi:GNAT superfamily N-acetyltransferase